jgi:hypothetical protein
MVLLDAVDAARLHEPVRAVARRVDAAMSAAVIADRLTCGNLAPHGYGWLLPWLPALGRLRSRASALASDGRHILLRTDVADCYASIASDRVESALVRLGAHPSEAGRVRGVLEALTEAGVRGLPVGPAASSILANAVLSAGDRSLEGTAFLRWVDDYLVFVRTEAEASAALDRLGETLDRVGLRLSEHKTSVGSAGGLSGVGCSRVGRGLTSLESLPT